MFLILDVSSTAYGSQPASFLSGPSSLPSRLSSPTFGREQASRRSELTSSFRWVWYFLCIFYTECI